MPALSTIDRLNPEDRAWLEKQLVGRKFADYDGLLQVLNERGLEISRSALGRFGKEYKEYVQNIRRSTDMAIMLSREIGDDANAVGDATIRMVQVQLFEAIQNYDFSKLEDAKPHQLISALADLNRATVGQKKWMAEARRAMDASKKALQGIIQSGPTEENLRKAEEALKLL
ncbi:MAG: phage protein Gp27 family protein [Kiritimatiellales bacterium]